VPLIREVFAEAFAHLPTELVEVVLGEAERTTMSSEAGQAAGLPQTLNADCVSRPDPVTVEFLGGEDQPPIVTDRNLERVRRIRHD
jgi:hypothetical protein